MPLQEQMRRLARLEPREDLPFLTVYLDVRPEATGENPQARSGLTVLKDRLGEIRKTFPPRGEDVDSFEADAQRIKAFVEQQMQASTKGLAIFACAARGVFETVEVEAPFENQVTVASSPDLFQLARLADERETSVVAVVDTNTARLFVYRLGRFSEDAGLDDDPVHYGKRATGGWRQMNNQRHVEKHRREFAAETARAIAELVQREEAQHVILAGDEVAITTLKEQLPQQVGGLVRDVVRLDIKTPQTAVAEAVEPILRQIEHDAAHSLVDQLIEEYRRGLIAVAGVHDTERALERGQVDLLLVDGAAYIDEGTRAHLVSRAVETGATVEVVQGSEALLRVGGVGALLRYPL